MGENRAARRGLISRVNRFFHSVCSPVQLRFRSPAARMPHVVISYLPSVARKYTLAVLGAVPRCDSGRAQRGYSSSAERRLPKPRRWVRFPLSAPRAQGSALHGSQSLLNVYDIPERRAATSPAMAQTRRVYADVQPVLFVLSTREPGTSPAVCTMPAHIRGGYSINRSGNETSISGSGVGGLIQPLSGRYSRRI